MNSHGKKSPTPKVEQPYSMHRAVLTQAYLSPITRTRAVSTQARLDHEAEGAPTEVHMNYASDWTMSPPSPPFSYLGRDLSCRLLVI